MRERKTRRDLVVEVEVLKQDLNDARLRLSLRESEMKKFIASQGQEERKAQLSAITAAGQMLDANARLVSALADVIQPRRV